MTGFNMQIHACSRRLLDLDYVRLLSSYAISDVFRRLLSRYGNHSFNLHAMDTASFRNSVFLEETILTVSVSQYVPKGCKNSALYKFFITLIRHIFDYQLYY
jgi:hypothetical protein